MPTLIKTSFCKKSHLNISNTHKKKIIYLDVHRLTLKKNNFHYIFFYRWKWIFHGNRVLTIQHQLRTSASSPETNLTVHLKKDTVQEDAIDMVLVHVDGLPQTSCVLKINIQRFYERQIVQDFILYQIQWFNIHSVLTILINWRNTGIDHCLLIFIWLCLIIRCVHIYISNQKYYEITCITFYYSIWCLRRNA